MNRSSDTDARRPGRHPQFRSPLLWILLPLIAGYAAARTFASGDPLLPTLGGLFCVVPSLSGLFRVGGRKATSGTWSMPLMAAVFLGGWAWWQVRVPELPPDWEILPPREVDLRLETWSVYQPPPYGHYWRGVGKITAADPLVAELEGQMAVFSTRAPADVSPLSRGTELAVRGIVRREEFDPDDPFSRYLKSQHIFFRINQGRLLESPASLSPLARLLAGWREDWNAILTRTIPGQERRANVLAAMLLGDRDLLAPDLEEAFMLSGTMHLFSVSGLHVMAVGSALMGIATLLRVPPKARGAVALTLLGVYVLVIGFPPSAVRAYAMLAFYGLGRVCSRRTGSFPAIVASAVVILLWDPRQLLSLGFQLSYAVVVAILVLGLPLGEALEARCRRRDPLGESDADFRWRHWPTVRRASIQALAISFAATLASAPLITFHFEIFTPGAILLNPLLMPIGALVVVDGMLVLFAGLLHLGQIGFFFAHGGWLLIALMELIINNSLKIPAMFSQRGWGIGWAEELTLGFLFLALMSHHRKLAIAWPPVIRFGIPIITVLFGMLIGTHAISG